MIRHVLLLVFLVGEIQARDGIACPDGISTNITQIALASRPQGDVTLTCVLSGVRHEQVEYYWWLIQELNAPIFQYSAKHGISDITPGHRFLVLNETHEFPPTGTETNIKMHINVSNLNTFECEFVLLDGSFCRNKISIKFEDPLMKIRYDRVILGFDDNFEPIVNTNITCSVWATAGKPHESIWINMTCGEDILSEMTYFENSGFYFEGALQQRYNSSMVEHCLCIVNDLHGTYGITKLISSQDCPQDIAIHLQQLSLASRILHDVDITCRFHGILPDQVEYYWWTTHETNYTLYTFHLDQDTHNTETITDYQNVREHHRMSSDIVSSTITVAVAPHKNSVVTCGIKTNNSNVCWNSMPVVYEDPTIRIISRGHFTVSDFPRLMSIACIVNATVGKPNVTIGYNGTEVEKFEIRSENTQYKYHNGFLTTEYETVVFTPANGWISCKVVDDIGRYIVTRRTAVRGPTMTNQNPRTGLYALFLLVLIPATVIALLIVSIRKERNEAVHNESEPQPLNASDTADTEELFFPTFFSEGAKQVQIKVYGKHDISDSVLPHIKYTDNLTLSNEPKLFVGNGPALSDIPDTTVSCEDNWFPVALYALCRNDKLDIRNVFQEAKDLKAPKIPIRLWNCGLWETIYVTGLPVKDNQPCYFQAENKCVFWVPLLQAALAKTMHRGDDTTRDAIALDVLTGGIVKEFLAEEQTEEIIMLNFMSEAIKKHYPMTCSLLVHEKDKSIFRTAFFCVTDLHKPAFRRWLVRLREFPCVDCDTKKEHNRVPDKYKYTGDAPHTEKYETWVELKIFLKKFEFNILYGDTITEDDDGKMVTYQMLKDFTGSWKHMTGGIYEDENYWTNPQYLLYFDAFKLPFHQNTAWLYIALIQSTAKEAKTAGAIANSEELLYIEYTVFEILDNVTPRCAFKKFNPKVLQLALEGVSLQNRVFLQVLQLDYWSKFVLVPHASKGDKETRFLFRMYAEYPKAVILKELLPERF